MGKLEPKGTAMAKVPVTENVADPQELCDACHATEARHIVHVGEKTLHLCSHHWRKHLVHIIAQGYHHKEVEAKK
jgi:hypothetical protein